MNTAKVEALPLPEVALWELWGLSQDVELGEPGAEAT